MKRLKDAADRIAQQGPHPAERMKGQPEVTPPRHVGNFSDRKTGHRKMVLQPKSTRV